MKWERYQEYKVNVETLGVFFCFVIWFCMLNFNAFKAAICACKFAVEIVDDVIVQIGVWEVTKCLFL